MTLEAGLELLFLGLIAVGILIFAYKKRKDVNDAFGFNKKTFWGNRMFLSTTSEEKQKIDSEKPTGSQKDYVQVLSNLITISRKKKWQIIAPAIVGIAQPMQFLAIIIMPQKIVAIRAYGFGGVLTETAGEKDWKQALKGDTTLHTVPNPIKGVRVAREILLDAMADKNLSIQNEMPVEVIAVYTNPKVTLHANTNSTCYKTAELFEYLQQQPMCEQEQEEKSKQQVEALKKIIQNLTTKKTKTRK